TDDFDGNRHLNGHLNPLLVFVHCKGHDRRALLYLPAVPASAQNQDAAHDQQPFNDSPSHGHGPSSSTKRVLTAAGESRSPTQIQPFALSSQTETPDRRLVATRPLQRPARQGATCSRRAVPV